MNLLIPLIAVGVGAYYLLKGSDKTQAKPETVSIKTPAGSLEHTQSGTTITIPEPETPASEVIKSEPMTDVDNSHVLYGSLDDCFDYASKSNNPVVWKAAADRLAESGDLRATVLAAKIAAAS